MGKVLVISPFNIFPPYWGAASRIYNLIKHLSNDYEITLLYVRSQQLSVDRMTDDPLILSGKVRFAGVTSFTKYSQIFNPLLILVGIILAILHKYSLILAETGWSGLHAMLLSFMTRVPYIVDEHNVEWMTFKRMNRGGRAGIFLLRLYERIICKYSHKIVCVSENGRRCGRRTLGQCCKGRESRGRQ